MKGGVTAAEIVAIAREIAAAGVAWASDGCAVFVRGVTNLMVASPVRIPSFFGG